MNELANNVRNELLEIQQMTEAQLREKWVALYGKKPPNFSEPFLRRRLAYRVQELAYGGVTEPTLQKIREVQVKSARKKPSKVNLRVGTIICRVWHRRRYDVTVMPDGFEWDGQIYPTLSAIASKISGTNRNGLEFFGIQRG